MSWDAQTWASWQRRLQTDWSASLADAWDDAIGAARGWVESNLSEAHKGAQRFWDLLYSPSTGIYKHLGTIWSVEGDLPAGELAAARQQIAAQLGLPVAEVTGSAFAGVADELSLGFIKDTSLPAEGRAEVGPPGILPLLVGGVIVGIGALCWTKVRLTQAEVENRNIQVAAGHLTLARDALKAKRENPNLDLNDVAGIARHDTVRSSSSEGDGGGGSSGLVVVGLVALGGLAVWALGRR